MKYKLNFKADDFTLSNNLTKAEDISWVEIVQLKEKIEQFYRTRLERVTGEQLTSAWSTDEKKFVITWVDSVLETNYTIEVNMPFRTVQRKYSNNTFLSVMSTDELKFFDMLDFELEPKYAKATGQDITDWFGEV